MNDRGYGILAGSIALSASSGLARKLDRPRSLGRVSIQSTESRERALAAAEAKRQRRAEKHQPKEPDHG
jgi:hypothetical protein